MVRELTQQARPERPQAEQKSLHQPTSQPATTLRVYIKALTGFRQASAQVISITRYSLMAVFEIGSSCRHSGWKVHFKGRGGVRGLSAPACRSTRGHVL